MADKDHGPRVGADPEVFVQTIGEGHVVPICGKVGGTKEEPLIFSRYVEAIHGAEAARRRNVLGDLDVRQSLPVGEYAVQEDNVMLEFNIPAATSTGRFCDYIAKALNVIEIQYLQPQKLEFKFEISHSFKPEDLAPFPQAFQIGCLPDMNAYADGDRIREPFSIIHFGNQRFCGGHLHVQYNKNRVPPHIFAQFMDFFTLPFLSYDSQRLRRLFYGQPGIYREKEYGIEYRTLSNFWLNKKFRDSGNATTLIENVFYLARSANGNPDVLSKAYGMIDWGDVQNAIKNEDTKLANELVAFGRERIGLAMGIAYQ